jgi:serine/threonine protein kinase
MPTTMTSSIATFSPENVLFVVGVLKVADFGLGKDLTSETLVLTASAAELGTPFYRARGWPW